MAKKVEAIRGERGFSKVAPMCSNCKYFMPEKGMITVWNGQQYPVEKKLRWGLGNFKVGEIIYMGYPEDAFGRA